QQLRQRNVPVGYIHSGMDKAEMAATMDALLMGKYKLFYLSPERLQSAQFLKQIEGLRIDFVAMDEAHCISQWGHDFRPAYRQISTFLSLYPIVVTLALTASATKVVQRDIIAQLQLCAPKVFELSVVRPNLSYEVAYEEAKTPRLTRYFNRNPQTGIIYCSARKRTVELAHELEQRDRKSTGLNSSHVKISYAVFCLRKKTKGLILQQNGGCGNNTAKVDWKPDTPFC